jgi:hypothetical protein
MELPVADRLFTVGLFAEQNDCAEVPVGADGFVVTVTVTSNLLVLSQPPTV